jgi:hypothetical protein
MHITQEDLKKSVSYNPDTGEFIRLIASGYRGRHKVGTKIGSLHRCGYVECMILGHRVLLHRLAFLYVTGKWPESEVDHIDGNRSNNAWSNLRQITHQANIQNQRKARGDNKSSKMLGCSFDKWSGKYVARIRSNGKYLNLGRFETAAEAHSAYLQAKRRLHEGNTL